MRGFERKIPLQRLIDFSGEHLYYEVKMLYGVVEILLDGVEDLYVYNALLESFVLHTSVMLDFFYRPAKEFDDARALHYVRDVKAWKEFLPVFNTKFGDFTRKRNKEVMHLTFKRLKVEPQEKQWGVRKLTKEIKKLMDAFLEQADPERLHPRIYELKSDRLAECLPTGPYAR